MQCRYVASTNRGRTLLDTPRKALVSKAESRLIDRFLRSPGLVGVSTHSFRRTALTWMSSVGIPLRVIQEISGHRSLQALQRYLEVSELQLEGAIAALSFIQ
ncbi:tyrosine-type recombinase/integrase [Trichocoleus sp. FACHB-262]|uniref:tyrosine-type recombinase/integrase n=1 Tax=Trichocoleus sp. FACHB-262 TaxID=2692869 RepID=UPI0016841213|nr:tyrosine-type recombinase/integrase [Trichocoleus sp. FACHB-262]MBD2121324.1 tyrosine-type recombinase/integrase [Trichocoleus sp. FACHB-262]